MTQGIKSNPWVSSRRGRQPRWRAFWLVMVALVQWSGRSFVQAQETNPSPTPTQEVNSAGQT
ncbi:MAG TPA: hypothetical protein VK859_02305, partial [bacterium]|nr:hypothetical protein [bacterium]